MKAEIFPHELNRMISVIPHMLAAKEAKHMRNQNAFWTEKMAEQNRRQRWDAFCQSGSISDYLEYRQCCSPEESVYADTSDSQGTGHSGNILS